MKPILPRTATPTTMTTTATATVAAVVLLILSGFGPVPAARASAEGNELRASDAELNDTYQETLSGLPSAAKAKLREAQRAWVAFRDAEVALYGSLEGTSGNTLKMLQSDLTEARTKQLKALAEAAR